MSVSPVREGRSGNRRLNDVLETERAVTGQPLALAPPAEVLTVRTFGVHVTWRSRAHAPRLVADLKKITIYKQIGTCKLQHLLSAV